MTAEKAKDSIQTTEWASVGNSATATFIALNWFRKIKSSRNRLQFFCFLLQCKWGQEHFFFNLRKISCLILGIYAEFWRKFHPGAVCTHTHTHIGMRQHKTEFTKNVKSTCHALILRWGSQQLSSSTKIKCGGVEEGQKLDRLRSEAEQNRILEYSSGEDRLWQEKAMSPMLVGLSKALGNWNKSRDFLFLDQQQ